VTPTKPTLNVVSDPVSRQPSPLLKTEELELKDAYLAGYKQVEEFFHKLLESLNFYKRKSSSLETEVQQLRDAKAKLEERIRTLEEETQGWELRREEREKRKEGKAINKVRRLVWSASFRHKSRTEGSTMPVTTAVEAK
jgi:phage shock protein A